MMKPVINVGEVEVEITNLDEFKNRLLDAIRFQLEAEVLKEIKRMKLVGTGLLADIESVRDGDSVLLWSSAPYAVYLEFGTFDYWKSYGSESFPEPGYPVIPKKKELSRAEAKKLPKGMQPFALFRRVLYNDSRMKRIIEKAVRSASK